MIFFDIKVFNSSSKRYAKQKTKSIIQLEHGTFKWEDNFSELLCTWNMSLIKNLIRNTQLNRHVF